MSESLPPYLAKAQRAIEIARRLSDSGDHDFAAGRAYHAMFYVAEALLWKRGLAFDTTSPSIDRRVSLGDGQPKQRRYRSRFVNHGTPVGDWIAAVQVEVRP